MRIGVGLPLASRQADVVDLFALAEVADQHGLDAIWVPEGYGLDAVSLLAAVAARTERLGIGAGVLQIPARTAAATAMAAAGLDVVSAGRLRLGLGVSGPQVSEGWHGVRFDDPIGRTREYVAAVRLALSRHRLVVQGEHLTLPLPDGPGIPLSLAFQTVRPTVPIYLAALGPRNLELTGQIADGWLGLFHDAAGGSSSIARIRAAATAAGRAPDAVDICVQLPTCLSDDPAAAAAALRPYAALYIGGMGSRTVNFYHRIACAMGYQREADQVQERFLARDYAGAAAAVPQEFLDRTCLLGDQATVTARLQQLADSGVDAVTIAPVNQPLAAQLETVRVLAPLAAAITRPERHEEHIG